MRVYEVAREFKIEPEKLLQLLRGLGATVRSEASAVDDATVAKLRARMERERRAGHVEEEAIEAVMEDATPTRRRRRKKSDVEAARAEEEAARAEEEAARAAEEPPAEIELPARKRSPFIEDQEPAAAEARTETASPVADAAEA